MLAARPHPLRAVRAFLSICLVVRSLSFFSSGFACMRIGSSPEGDGIFGIVVALLVACAAITCVTGGFIQWPIVLLAVIVGVMAVGSINR